MANRPFITMNMGRLQADIRAVKAKLQELPKKLTAALSRAMVKVASDILQHAQQAARVRTGALRNSGTVTEPVIFGFRVTLRMGFNIRYARQRDQGGVIRPVRAKMLAIPLRPILTARGEPRFKSPREERDLFVLQLATGLYLAKRRRKGGKGFQNISLHWRLANKVEQKGDRFLTGTFQQHHRDIPRRVAELLQREIPRVA